MKLVFTLISLSLYLFQVFPVAAARQQPNTKSFAQWCQQKNSVPAVIQHTIDLLLREAGTQECQLADSKLQNLTSLSFESQRIEDIQPLANFSNLTHLELRKNQIRDLQPLTRLTNLTYLGLNENKIRDLHPLTGLNKLPLGFCNIFNLFAANFLPICSVKQEPTNNILSVIFIFTGKGLGVNSERNCIKIIYKKQKNEL